MWLLLPRARVQNGLSEDGTLIVLLVFYYYKQKGSWEVGHGKQVLRKLEGGSMTSDAFLLFCCSR